MKLSVSSLASKERVEQKEKDLQWAQQIKARDSFICVICGLPFFPNAHHIIPREVKEYRHESSNGVTLCRNHHKFSRVISAHNNPLAFYLWLERFRPLTFEIAKSRTKEILSKEGILI